MSDSSVPVDNDETSPITFANGGPAYSYWPPLRDAWLLNMAQAYWGRTLATEELKTWDAYLAINDWAATVGNFASKPVGWNVMPGG